MARKHLLRCQMREKSCIAFARPRPFGLGIAPKETISCLINPVSIEEEDLYLETWLWSPLICMEKVPCGSGYARLCEQMRF